MEEWLSQLKSIPVYAIFLSLYTRTSSQTLSNVFSNAFDKSRKDLVYLGKDWRQKHNKQYDLLK